jgi:hypothetical protein
MRYAYENLKSWDGFYYRRFVSFDARGVLPKQTVSTATRELFPANLDLRRTGGSFLPPCRCPAVPPDNSPSTDEIPGKAGTPGGDGGGRRRPDER